MLQHYFPDTPLQVKGSSFHYFFVSMVTVPGGKDHLKVCRKSIIFQTVSEKLQHGVCLQDQGAPPAQQKQTGKAVVRVSGCS